jgi:hypothetical protein
MITFHNVVFARLMKLAGVAILAVAFCTVDAVAKNKKNGNHNGNEKQSTKAAGKKEQKKSGGKKKKSGKGKRHRKGGGKHASTASVVNPQVMSRLLADNPGLSPNFLKTDLPGRTIKLSNGQTVPIYKLKQFLDVNFQLTFYARKKEKGSSVVEQSEMRLRKLLALPEFYERVKTHKSHYKIAGKGKISSTGAYWYIRNINRRLGVTASEKVKAPVGGGGGINAPSWAVWKAMNLFWHEACHCIGIGHDSGGISGPIAGTLRKWDKKKLWKYETIDLNRL